MPAVAAAGAAFSARLDDNNCLSAFAVRYGHLPAGQFPHPCQSMSSATCRKVLRRGDKCRRNRRHGIISKIIIMCRRRHAASAWAAACGMRQRGGYSTVQLQYGGRCGCGCGLAGRSDTIIATSLATSFWRQPIKLLDVHLSSQSSKRLGRLTTKNDPRTPKFYVCESRTWQALVIIFNNRHEDRVRSFLRVWRAFPDENARTVPF